MLLSQTCLKDSHLASHEYMKWDSMRRELLEVGVLKGLQDSTIQLPMTMCSSLGLLTPTVLSVRQAFLNCKSRLNHSVPKGDQTVITTYAGTVMVKSPDIRQSLEEEEERHGNMEMVSAHVKIVEVLKKTSYTAAIEQVTLYWWES